MTHSIVIGGSKGLGRVVARLMALRGDRVSVVSRVVSPAPAPSGTAHFCADIADPVATREALNSSIGLFGEPSYLVFCQRYRSEDDPWAGELEVSLSSTRRVMEELGDRFASGGDNAIVFVSSPYAEWVGDGQGIGYHVAKAALNQMSRYYAVNLGRKGIRCNTVTPSTYLKDESKVQYLAQPELLELYRKIVPLGRIGTAEESADVIAFLCSVAARFVTGQNISVDGGLSLVWPESLAKRLASTD